MKIKIPIPMLKITSAVLAVFVLGTAASAAPITSSSFFTGSDTTIDFESFAPAQDSPLTTEYQSLGVVFSGESNPNTSQATDPADLTNRFDAHLRVFNQPLDVPTGGGTPTSGTQYVGPYAFLNRSLNVSDMRFDFVNGVLAFGMQIIDNDFSVARLQAFDAAGVLLETVVVPQVGEGGFAFHGIDVTGTGNTIAYAILDGNNGSPLDSTFIDDFSFRNAQAAVPVPAAVWLFGSALLGLIGFSRRRMAA